MSVNVVILADAASPVHWTNVIIGGFGLLMGLLLYFSQRRHPEAVRGFTYRQFVIGCIFIIVVSVLFLLAQFL